MTAHGAPFGRYRCGYCGSTYDCQRHYDEHLTVHEARHLAAPPAGVVA